MWLGYTEDQCGAQWLESTTDDRVVTGWNPTAVASKLVQVRLLHIVSGYRRMHYKPSVPSIWCLCQGK